MIDHILDTHKYVNSLLKYTTLSILCLKNNSIDSVKRYCFDYNEIT